MGYNLVVEAIRRIGTQCVVVGAGTATAIALQGRGWREVTSHGLMAAAAVGSVLVMAEMKKGARSLVLVSDNLPTWRGGEKGVGLKRRGPFRVGIPVPLGLTEVTARPRS